MLDFHKKINNNLIKKYSNKINIWDIDNMIKSYDDINNIVDKERM
jgi:hypothetical protein